MRAPETAVIRVGLRGLTWKWELAQNSTVPSSIHMKGNIHLHFIALHPYTFYIHVPVSTDIPDAQLSTMDLMLGEGREEKKLQNS